MWVRESGLGVWAKGCVLPLLGPFPKTSAGCCGAKVLGQLLGGAEVVAGSVARSLRLGSGVEVRVCAHRAFRRQKTCKEKRVKVVDTVRVISCLGKPGQSRGTEKSPDVLVGKCNTKVF